jgi:hypothetical protein
MIPEHPKQQLGASGGQIARLDLGRMHSGDKWGASGGQVTGGK